MGFVPWDCVSHDVYSLSNCLGNKCAGGSVLSTKGLVVHDSHAEQLARRGFLRFINRRRISK
jgi:hypothetical protein